MTTDMPPAEAGCPRCGYFTLRMIGGTTLSCDRPECGYEHLVTTAIPIIKPNTNEG